MDRTYEESRVKMEGPLMCNRPKGHEGKHECVVGDRLLACWSHDAAIKNELPSVEEMIVRVFPELSLVTASVVERFLKSREKTCTCASIMADDSTRHFRGCPLREKYPTHEAEHVCTLENCGH